VPPLRDSNLRPTHYEAPAIPAELKAAVEEGFRLANRPRVAEGGHYLAGYRNRSRRASIFCACGWRGRGLGGGHRPPHGRKSCFGWSRATGCAAVGPDEGARNPIGLIGSSGQRAHAALGAIVTRDGMRSPGLEKWWSPGGPVGRGRRGKKRGPQGSRVRPSGPCGRASPWAIHRPPVRKARGRRPPAHRRTAIRAVTAVRRQNLLIASRAAAGSPAISACYTLQDAASRWLGFWPQAPAGLERVRAVSRRFQVTGRRQRRGDEARPQRHSRSWQKPGPTLLSAERRRAAHHNARRKERLHTISCVNALPRGLRAHTPR